VAAGDTLDELQAVLGPGYVLQRQLGSGGMATVYLAQDAKHGRLVALKVLHSDLAASLGPERFRREIGLAARLQHPHILSVYDSGETSTGHLWFTMPYVEGESLRDRLRRERQLPVDEALRITREVAQTLDYAHRRGIVHRDIKPENIIITDENVAKIVDFGLAKLMEQTSLREDFAGTIDYMAPEQIHGASDSRTDLWALGVMLYEMLTGSRPFRGREESEIMQAILENPVPAIADVPAEVRELITKALDKSTHEPY